MPGTKELTNEELADLLTNLTEVKDQYEENNKKFDELLTQADKTDATVEELAKTVKESNKSFEKFKKLEADFNAFILKQDRQHESFKKTSLGDQIIKSDSFKKYLENGKIGGAHIRVKSITNLTAGELLTPDKKIIDPVTAALMIRDLIPKTRTDKDTITYTTERTFDNAATGVDQGMQKPESTITFKDEDFKVITIAHFIRASLQILDDVPFLEGFLNNRMVYGLKEKEEQQLLFGAGGSTELKGLMSNAAVYNAAVLAKLKTTLPTRIDELLAARAVASSTSKYNSSAYVLNPMDWAKLLATKDANGRYLLGNPDSEAVAKLWALPVVMSFSMPEDKFLVGAFDRACELADREDANIKISTEDDDNFQTNRATIRCEERIALCIVNSDAFMGGTFTIPAIPAP